jgi:hypothetical protein
MPWRATCSAAKLFPPWPFTDQDAPETLAAERAEQLL